MKLKCGFCGHEHHKDDDFKRKLVCGRNAIVCAVCVRLCQSVCFDHLTIDQLSEVDCELKKQSEEQGKKIQQMIDNGEITLNLPSVESK